ncbi:hypothetical protein T4E_5184 [Trichinella pseudospiralis]|uniref:Uncharacterized protein n=1 Tax=Trichinella pseudospiralis TaxID=6337 RepID=A0A0V0XF49_TRIPS|nr:hypothetical protein T4E_5184 [Trichinella pseudospiralis]
MISRSNKTKINLTIKKLIEKDNINRHVISAMDPRITWSPWKPVVMKNTLPFTPLDMVNVDL